MRVKAALLGAVLLVLLPEPARATSLMAEVTGGKGGLGGSLLLDLPLGSDRTHLGLCYGVFRAEGMLEPLHQVCAGVDHLLGDHWLLSAVASFSPTTQGRSELLEVLRYQVNTRSLGGGLSAAWQSGGFSELEWSFDASVSLTAWNVGEDWVVTDRTGASHTVTSEELLLSLRPGLGAVALLGDGWELSLRGSYHLYSSDPLQVGRLTEDDLLRLAGSLERLRLSETFRQRLAQRLAEGLSRMDAGGFLQADARSGLQIAPLLFEVRPGVSYRFNATLRGELFFSHQQYVPGQGSSQVVSTRWTVRLGQAVRLWGTGALQVDRPVGVAPSRALLFSGGADVSF